MQKKKKMEKKSYQKCSAIHCFDLRLTNSKLQLKMKSKKQKQNKYLSLQCRTDAKLIHK